MWGRHGDSTAHGPGRLLLLESDSDLETVLLGPESFKTLTRPWEPPRAGRAGGGGGALRLTGALSGGEAGPPRLCGCCTRSHLCPPRAVSLTRGLFSSWSHPSGCRGLGDVSLLL